MLLMIILNFETLNQLFILDYAVAVPYWFPFLGDIWQYLETLVVIIQGMLLAPRKQGTGVLLNILCTGPPSPASAQRVVQPNPMSGDTQSTSVTSCRRILNSLLTLLHSFSFPHCVCVSPADKIFLVLTSLLLETDFIVWFLKKACCFNLA